MTVDTTARAFGTNITNSPTKNPHLKNSFSKVLITEERAFTAYENTKEADADAAHHAKNSKANKMVCNTADCTTVVGRKNSTAMKAVRSGARDVKKKCCQ